MTGLVIVTFDMHEAVPEDYVYVTEHLAKIGLKKDVVGRKKIVLSLPNNTYLMEIEPPENSRQYVIDMRKKVKEIIKRRVKEAEVYVLIAPSNWGWAFGKVK
jgi:hypothetical protein